jgi:hypothetical protein
MATEQVKVTFEIQVEVTVADNDDAIAEAMDRIAEDVTHALGYHKNFEVVRGEATT